MTIKNLSNISFDAILASFLLAFEHYYVKMPTDRSYYKQRWKAAKVDFNLSYGMFDDERLVGFIIHAIDKRVGILTAFNTGTGVIPEYRGNRIVKSIYEYALKDLKNHSIEKCTLEVITNNSIAIQAYESVRFKICQKYKCYDGNIQSDNSNDYELKKVALKIIDWEKLPNQQYYSWDFQKETILEGDYTFYQVLKDNKPESFFITNSENHYLAQFDILNTENKGWKRLFSAIKQVSDEIKVINVDERLKDKLENINSAGLENSVNQYEMDVKIRGEQGRKPAVN